MKIVIYEELVENSQNVLPDVYDFLEIDLIDSELSFEKETDIDNEIKVMLGEFYEPYNIELKELIGRNIDAWG